MRWLKRDRWKAGIALAGVLLLLVLMVWVPVSVAGAYEVALGRATPGTGTVQATPTEDATVTALNKEKLAQEVQQLKNQNAPDLFAWFRTNASILLVVGGGLFGLWRWLTDRRDAQDKELEDRKAERERRDEERFQAVIASLGSNNIEARAVAAIMLRTFLQPGYEQFYRQAFDLAVTHLRLRHADPNAPEPLDSLSQALIAVFKEAFPLTRSQNKGGVLDASRVQLDNAYLREADLKQIWMLQASLRKVNLSGATLSEATLSGATLSGANFSRANLGGAKLSGLKRDVLRSWEFGLAPIVASFHKANLSGADLRGADLRDVDLSEANLSGADLNGADLRKAGLWEVNLEDVASLEGTDLRGVQRLTYKQLEACKTKGAVFGALPDPENAPRRRIARFRPL